MSAAVAVAVVSWNTRDLLARCLRSLERDEAEGVAEVWVVDNGSTDGSAELVEREFGWAHLIRPGDNLGFGRAVNLVARETASEWVAAANADVAVEPGALRALLRTGDAHPSAGAVAPRLVLPDGRTQHSVHPFPTLSFTALFNLGLHRLSRASADRLCLEGYWDHERRREVDWAVGAFLLLRRDAFETIGGFDERLWLYAEDLDLGWRLRSAGRATIYEPQARVLHEQGAAATQAFGRDQTRAWMTATYRWLALRRGLTIALLTGVVNVAGAATRYAAASAAATVAPARFAHGRDRNKRWLRAHVSGLVTARLSESARGARRGEPTSRRAPSA